MISALVVSAVLNAPGNDPVDLTVLQDGTNTVTLDEGWAPYGQSTISVAVPAVSTLALMDPATYPRVTVTAQSSQLASNVFVPGDTRTFDLALTDRSWDQVQDQVTLTLDTDEALLQGYVEPSTSVDTTPLQYQSSVRAMCSYVLGKIGATLSAGTVDADFTTTQALTNLLSDPACTTTTGRTVVGGTITEASGVGDPAPSLKVTANVTTGTSVTYPSSGSYISATPGTQYYAQLLVDAQSTGCTGTVYLRWYDSNGNVISTTAASAVSLTQYSWVLLEVTGVCPAAASQVAVIVQVNGMSSGGSFYTDQWMCVEGTGKETDTVTRLAYFDGSTAATTYYTYSWGGTANASESSRTPLNDRTPDAGSWQPDQDAYDFISGIVSASSLRLFCDEARVWRLVDPTYAVPGRLSVLAGYNAYQATDDMSLTSVDDAGAPVYFQACKVHWSWLDQTGTQQDVWEYYTAVTDPARTYVVTMDRPYPGAGLAQYMVTRSQGKGRTLALTAATDLTATPGMQSLVTIPPTSDLTGYVASIGWDLSNDEMTVGTRGLTVTPSNSWAEVPATLEWSGIGGSTEWTGWQPPAWT